MAKRIILILGDRHTTADLVQKLAFDIGGPTLIVATGMDELPHPDGWRAIHEPLHVADALETEARNADTIVLDNLPAWVANIRESIAPDMSAAEAMLQTELGTLHDWSRSSPASLVVVSEEAPQPLLGLANQRLATLATEVYLLIAGIPIELKQLSARPWRQDAPYDK